MSPRKDSSPPPLLKEAIITPKSFVETEPPDWIVGVKAMRNIPEEERVQNMRIRRV